MKLSTTQRDIALKMKNGAMILKTWGDKPALHFPDSTYEDFDQIVFESMMSGGIIKMDQKSSFLGVDVFMFTDYGMEALKETE